MPHAFLSFLMHRMEQKGVERMEDVIVEIPQPSEETPWEPPVLKTEVHEGKPEKKDVQSAADVFFMQYVICILVLTLLLVIRLYDEELFRDVTNTFSERMHAPSVPWAENLVQTVRGLWS